MKVEGSDHSCFGLAHIQLQQPSIRGVMFFATFVKCRSEEAIRICQNASSISINRFQSFNESAVAGWPMRGASVSEGRHNERADRVFATTPGVFAIGFALFFTCGTVGAARNWGERSITRCCSSTCSTHDIDSLVGVACFARSFRAAHNCSIGTGARR